MRTSNHRLDYATFELLIGAHTHAGYPLTVIQSPAGETTAHCHLDPAGGELLDALAAVAARNVDAAFLTQVGPCLTNVSPGATRLK